MFLPHGGTYVQTLLDKFCASVFDPRGATYVQTLSDKFRASVFEVNGYAYVKILLDKFRASVFDRTKDGSTLMHIAALNGHPETAMVGTSFR